MMTIERASAAAHCMTPENEALPPPASASDAMVAETSGATRPAPRTKTTRSRVSSIVGREDANLRTSHKAMTISVMFALDRMSAVESVSPTKRFAVTFPARNAARSACSSRNFIRSRIDAASALGNQTTAIRPSPRVSSMLTKASMANARKPKMQAIRVVPSGRKRPLYNAIGDGRLAIAASPRRFGIEPSGPWNAATLFPVERQ